METLKLGKFVKGEFKQGKEGRTMTGAKAPFGISDIKKAGKAQLEMTQSIEMKSPLRINTFDMDMVTNSSLAPKFVATVVNNPNKQVVQQPPSTSSNSTKTSPLRVKKFIELGSRVRVPHDQLAAAPANGSSIASNDLESGGSNPTNIMANQLRANSYIDRKSSCEEAVSPRGILDRTAHNKTAVFNTTGLNGQ